MRNKAIYFGIYLVPMGVTWVLLIPNVPKKSGWIYTVLTLLLWIGIILYFPLSSLYKEFLVRRFRGIFVTDRIPILILISMLTLVSVSCALMTQAVFYPVVRGELALLAGLILLVMEIRRS